MSNEQREQQMMDAADRYADEVCDESCTGAQVAETINDFCAGWRAADSYPNWISVEDELPEKGKDVLVWSSGSDEPMVGYYRHWNWQRKQHMFYVHNDGNMWGNITHWMPMPAAPRKEE